MRCLACQKNLTDREASFKYPDWPSIPNPEERYIGLCDKCRDDAGLAGEPNPLASDEEYQDEVEVVDTPDEAL